MKFLLLENYHLNIFFQNYLESKVCFFGRTNFSSKIEFWKRQYKSLFWRAKNCYNHIEFWKNGIRRKSLSHFENPSWESLSWKSLLQKMFEWAGTMWQFLFKGNAAFRERERVSSPEWDFIVTILCWVLSDET